MKITKTLVTCAFLSLIVSILLTVIGFWSFYMPFYENEYVQNNTVQATGMKHDDLIKTTEVLFDYLKDNRDDLIVRVSVHGYVREVFDTREKLHMKDVKKLYLNAMKVRNYLSIIAVVLIIAAYIIQKHGYRKILLNGYGTALIIFGVFILALLFYAMLDFSSFWINFHEVFFDNDLYLLDPNTEILINMVPERFFFDLVMRIISSFMALCAFLYIVLKVIAGRKANV